MKTKTQEEYKYKIYIDSTDRKNNKVVLMEGGGKVVDEITGELDVVASLSELLKKHSISPSEINVYDANPGPGSFTGIKVGVTAVNVINWALGKKTAAELITPIYGQEPNINPPV